MNARDNSIYLAREFATHAIPAAQWNDDDVLGSMEAAGRLAASLLRKLFQFVEDSNFTVQERQTLLYADARGSFSMRNGALRTLLWIKDRVNAETPDLAGIIFIWAVFFGAALDEVEESPEGRGPAADLAFEVLLQSLPASAENGDLGAYALRYADTAARLDTAFGAGTGNGRARAEVLRLLQAHYARRVMPPPASTAFESLREMRFLIQAYWDEADARRAALSVAQQLAHLRDWWQTVAMASARRFIAAGAAPASILVPTGHFKPQRQTFGDVWAQSLLRYALVVARCRNYDEHIALLRVVDVLMLVNQDLAESSVDRRLAELIGLRLQQKIMRATTVILRAGSPRIEVARLKSTLGEVLERYITSDSYVEIRALLGDDELALLRAFSAALDYTYGNPRQSWSAVPLEGGEAQVKWRPSDGAWVREHASA